MRVLIEPPARTATHVERVSLPGAVDDRLYFAQVREDPILELEALQPTADGSLVVVGSGGCTALSLVAAGAGRVASVDYNRSQNHLVELKVAAIAGLSHMDVLGVLGAHDAPASRRRNAYGELRAGLSPAARAFWDARGSTLERGVLNAGVTEGFIRGVTAAFRTFVHSRTRIERMLASTSIDEQRSLFEREWNTVRWRMFFQLLLNRVVFRKTYDPAFFAHVQRPSFAHHFRARAEHTLTRLSVRDNYFLQHMLTGAYSSLPPYLTVSATQAIQRARDALTLVDGSMTDYLRTQPAASISGFALSNICEWLTPAAIDELFAEVVRTARPDARLVFRNFVGWTEVPERWRSTVVEDRILGEALIARDRAVVQRRIAVCRVHGVRP
jgi:S-adenosylmethionine-diacylglycerol 3-amino-3-carboxypropyl transferase